MATPSVRVAAVIPARMVSSRFPGKPLVRVRGLPMVEHVRRRALLCRAFSEVVVATCDNEIASVVESAGGRCVMTSPDHPAATDRVAEAMAHLDCTHVVNVQGDEILILPQDLDAMVQAMAAQPAVLAWNDVAPIEASEALSDRSVVKCAVSAAGRILFCSRDFSWLRGTLGPGFEPLRIILGILGYERSFLERYGRLARTPLEQAEGIDQSRIIEHDVILRAVPFAKGYPGINEPREVALVEQYLDRDPAQQAVLQEMLAWVA